MFCKKCDNQLSEGSDFCSGCGTPQGLHNPSVPVQTNTDGFIHLPSEKLRFKNNSKIALVAGILAIVCGSFYFVMNIKYLAEVFEFPNIFDAVIHIANILAGIFIICFGKKNLKNNAYVFMAIGALQAILLFWRLPNFFNSYLLVPMDIIVGITLIISFILFSLYIISNEKKFSFAPQLLLIIAMVDTAITVFTFIQYRITLFSFIQYRIYRITLFSFIEYRITFFNIVYLISNIWVILFALAIMKETVGANKFDYKLYSLGKLGIVFLPVGLIGSILIAIISSSLWGEVYFYKYSYYSGNLYNNIYGILWVVAITAIIFGITTIPFFLANQKNAEKFNIENAPNNAKYIPQGNVSDGYIEIVKHFLLLLFTFGIWQFIWIYRTTRYLNRTPNAEQYDPTSKLLLCIFVPFYYIYWIYKQGQKIDTLSKIKNPSHSDMATTFLILGIFISIVAYTMMQDKINSIAKSSDVSSSQMPESIKNELPDL